MMLCALLALLCGCASPVWETVSDDVPQEEAIAVWQQEAYTITLGLPRKRYSRRRTRDGRATGWRRRGWRL